MIKPHALLPGDTIRLVAPSSPPKDRASLEMAIMAIKTRGYRVKYSDSIFGRSGYLAGSDEERARDFEAAFADDKAQAVLCVRGGYGATRILNHIDWRTVRQPKVFMGFSDITALNCALWKKCGFPSFSGPVLTSDLSDENLDAHSWDHALSLLSGERRKGKLLTEPFNLSHPTAIVPGESHGRLIGGNLSILCSLLGTPWFPNVSNAILFLEDVGEPPYKVDRYLTQLRDAGILKQVAGIVLGDFGYSEMLRNRDEKQGMQTMEAVLQDRLSDLGVPVLANLPFGHIKPKITIPFGVLVILDANQRNLLLQESGVEI